jgi:predicted nucleic acid-binding protein
MSHRLQVLLEEAEFREIRRARDAFHVAVMERRGVGRMMSFDSGFDVVPGLVRVS